MFEEINKGSQNNIYHLYNKYEDGQVNWYNKDNKLLFTISDRVIEFSDIDDLTFENYFNCSLNDFHNTYDKFIVTDLDNNTTIILNKMLTSKDGYYGIVYINGTNEMSFTFMIIRTTDATNYIRAMGSFNV